MYFDKGKPKTEYKPYREDLNYSSKSYAYSQLTSLIYFLRLEGNITTETEQHFYNQLSVFADYAAGRFLEDELREIEEYGFKGK